MRDFCVLFNGIFWRSFGVLFGVQDGEKSEVKGKFFGWKCAE
jgi:hypothetical protein